MSALVASGLTDFLHDAVEPQVQADAIGLGAVFALMAVGIGLVFGVLRLINFAYGQLVMAGGFALAGIPPGRYRLAAWSESLPRVEREVRLAAGQTLRAELVLGSATAVPAAPSNSP